MKLDVKQAQRYQKLFTGLWQMTKEKGIPEDPDAYWDDILQNAENLDHAFGNMTKINDPFAHEIIRGWMRGIERTWEEGRNKPKVAV